MAPGDRDREAADTDDLPDARDAFAERGAERGDSGAVSRAATLLVLVRPKGAAGTAFRDASKEARDLLGVTPVDASRHQAELTDRLLELGRPGQRAAQLAEELRPRRGRQAGEELASLEGGMIPLGDQPSVASQIRATSRDERDVVETAQETAVRSLVQGGGSSAGRTASAVQLVAASLLDNDPLVQVAASAAAMRISPRDPLANAVLSESATKVEGEVGELARAVLASNRERETRRVEVEESGGPAARRPDAALIHGTWARRGRWWSPGGGLHRYLKTEAGLFPNLYSGEDPFKWSGYFSFRAWKPTGTDWHRRQASDSLAWWAERRLTGLPDLLGHSYGGTLALLATQAEKELRGAVLLSPALHQSSVPDDRYYDQILHVHSKMDLVLLADLTDSSLLNDVPRVTTWPMKRRGLTGHSTSHDPEAWAKSGLTAFVRDEWMPQLSSR